MSIRFFLKAERRHGGVTVSEYFEGEPRLDDRGHVLSQPAGRVDEDIKRSNKEAYEKFRAEVDPHERQIHEKLIAEFLESEKVKE